MERLSHRAITILSKATVRHNTANPVRQADLMKGIVV